MRPCLTRFLVGITVVISLTKAYSQKKMNSIEKNGLLVKWEYKADRIYFQLSAPTNGWVGIGFNEHENTTGNYLILGHVINGKVDVAEHYTSSPGNYKRFSELKTVTSVQHIKGIETAHSTDVSFSLPIQSNSKYARNLAEGSEFVLLMAYSREDDFQHHSMMRTFVKIKL